MLWGSSLYEMTGGHELRRTVRMTHDNMQNGEFVYTLYPVYKELLTNGIIIITSMPIT